MYTRRPGRDISPASISFESKAFFVPIMRWDDIWRCSTTLEFEVRSRSIMVDHFSVHWEVVSFCSIIIDTKHLSLYNLLVLRNLGNDWWSTTSHQTREKQLGILRQVAMRNIQGFWYCTNDVWIAQLTGSGYSEEVESAWQATLGECRRKWITSNVTAASVMSNSKVWNRTHCGCVIESSRRRVIFTIHGNHPGTRLSMGTYATVNYCVYEQLLWKKEERAKGSGGAPRKAVGRQWRGFQSWIRNHFSNCEYFSVFFVFCFVIGAWYLLHSLKPERNGAPLLFDGLDFFPTWNQWEPSHYLDTLWD